MLMSMPVPMFIWVFLISVGVIGAPEGAHPRVLFGCVALASPSLGCVALASPVIGAPKGAHPEPSLGCVASASPVIGAPKGAHPGTALGCVALASPVTYSTLRCT